MAILAGAALGYGLSYIFLSPGTVVQTNFSAFRTLAYIPSATTSPIQVADTQLSITTSGASNIIVRFSTAFTIYLFQNHNGITRFQINLTMNGVTKSIQYLEDSSDGPVSSVSGVERGGSLILEFVTEALPAGTYLFKIMWRSTASGGSVNSQLIFCSSNFNSTRSLFGQEIRI